MQRSARLLWLLLSLLGLAGSSAKKGKSKQVLADPCTDRRYKRLEAGTPLKDVVGTMQWKYYCLEVPLVEGGMLSSIAITMSPYSGDPDLFYSTIGFEKSSFKWDNSVAGPGVEIVSFPPDGPQWRAALAARAAANRTSAYFYFGVVGMEGNSIFGLEVVTKTGRVPVPPGAGKRPGSENNTTAVTQTPAPTPSNTPSSSEAAPTPVAVQQEVVAAVVDAGGEVAVALSDGEAVVSEAVATTAPEEAVADAPAQPSPAAVQQGATPQEQEEETTPTPPPSTLAEKLAARRRQRTGGSSTKSEAAPAAPSADKAASSTPASGGSSTGTPATTTIQMGYPVTDVIEGMGWKYYRLTARRAGGFTLKLDVTAGDADLYVSTAPPPGGRTFPFNETSAGPGSESLVVAETAAHYGGLGATYYIGVMGWERRNAYSLGATFLPTGTPQPTSTKGGAPGRAARRAEPIATSAETAPSATPEPIPLDTLPLLPAATDLSLALRPGGAKYLRFIMERPVAWRLTASLLEPSPVGLSLYVSGDPSVGSNSTSLDLDFFSKYDDFASAAGAAGTSASLTVTSASARERGAGYIYVLAVVAGSDAGEAARGAVVFFNLRADYLPEEEAGAGGEAGAGTQEAASEEDAALAAADGSHSMLSWRLGQ